MFSAFSTNFLSHSFTHRHMNTCKASHAMCCWINSTTNVVTVCDIVQYEINPKWKSYMQNFLLYLTVFLSLHILRLLRLVLSLCRSLANDFVSLSYSLMRNLDLSTSLNSFFLSPSFPFPFFISICCIVLCRSILMPIQQKKI